MIILCASIIMMSCSKSSDTPKEVDNGLPTRVELDIPKLNSYIGQSFDVVHKDLEKNAFEIKSSLGDRYFTIGANAEQHDGLSVEIKESKKIISEINIQYNGVVGGDAIGDPYENELWYYMLQKVQSLYGQSSTRVYIKGSNSRLLASNDALVQYVKENGFKGAAYASTWNNTQNTITVFHSDAGRFLLQLKAK
jgi:hypothetical protein